MTNIIAKRIKLYCYESDRESVLPNNALQDNRHNLQSFLGAYWDSGIHRLAYALNW